MSILIEELKVVLPEEILARLAVIRHDEEMYQASCHVYEETFGEFELQVFSFATSFSNESIWETIINQCHAETPLALLLNDNQSIWIDVQNKIPYFKKVILNVMAQSILTIDAMSMDELMDNETLTLEYIATTSKTKFSPEEHEHLLSAYVRISKICEKTHTVKFEEIEAAKINKLHYIAEKGDIIFVKQRPRSDKFAYVEQSCIVPMSCLILRAKKGYSSELLFSLLSLEKMQRNIQQMINKRTNITKNDILNVLLPYSEIRNEWGVIAEIVVNEWRQLRNEPIALNHICNTNLKCVTNPSKYAGVFGQDENRIWTYPVTKLFEIVLYKNQSDTIWTIPPMSENDYVLSKPNMQGNIPARPSGNYLEKGDIILTWGPGGVHSAIVDKHAIDLLPNQKQVVLRSKDKQLEEIFSHIYTNSSRKKEVLKNFKMQFIKYMVFYFRTDSMQQELAKVSLDKQHKSFEKIKVVILEIFEYAAARIEQQFQEEKEQKSLHVLYEKITQLDTLFFQLDELVENIAKSKHIQIQNRLALRPNLLQEIIAVYLMHYVTKIDIHFYNYLLEIRTLEQRWNGNHLAKPYLYKLPLYDESLKEDAYSVYYDFEFNIEYEPDIIIASAHLETAQLNQGIQIATIVEILGGDMHV